jgi:phenylacetate-CoA ligase
MANLLEIIWARQPFRRLKGIASAYIAYPISEYFEKRDIRSKLRDLRKHYAMPIEQRHEIARQRLVAVLSFANTNVPYYRDLFRSLKFDPEKVRRDPLYLQELPHLTKDIIREQGERLLSRPLNDIRHHACKTGGSTGLSCVIYYDQEAADHSAAVTLYARERIGKRKYKPELHFACRFPDAEKTKWPNREDFKCLAMNRSNIFFDRLDDKGLEEIWRVLKRRKSYLVHAHPSTIYSLACYIKRKLGFDRAFEIFESSGELLEHYQREAITNTLQCRVIDRYGLAELGVMAYELEGPKTGLQVLESEGWPESIDAERGENGEQELLFTGFRNKLMPLIRYRTGDLAKVEKRSNGFYLTNVVGRIHDLVPIHGIEHATHHIQDMLDHRVGGIQEFQIDLRTARPTLKIVPETSANQEHIKSKIEQFWGNGFGVQFVGHDDFVRVGRHAKFRHVVNSS